MATITVRGTPVIVSRTSSPVVTGGALAGLTGGILMAIFVMLYTGVVWGNFLAILQWMGATFGVIEAAGSGVAIVWGLLVHVAVSMALGALFVEIAGPGLSRGAAILAGIAYGIAVMLVMAYLVLPWANPVLFTQIQIMWGAWTIGHVLFGLGLAVTPALVKAMITPPPTATTTTTTPSTAPPPPAEPPPPTRPI